MGRCKAVNLCGYCAIQAAHENARMLALDAAEGDAPEVVMILGTRTPTDDPAPFHYARQEVIRALRVEFGRGVEYACLAEFTTGYGPRSGGLRRPHWNVMPKGIPSAGVDRAREIAREVWCRHVDAAPERQYVEALRSTGAFMSYVANHFQKESQAPPKGWRGQRFNASRGYFTGRTRAEAREAARKSLRVDREVWKAHQRGLRGEALQEAVDAALGVADATTWRLLQVHATTAGEGEAPHLTMRRRLVT